MPRIPRYKTKLQTRKSIPLNKKLQFYPLKIRGTGSLLWAGFNRKKNIFITLALQTQRMKYKGHTLHGVKSFHNIPSTPACARTSYSMFSSWLTIKSVLAPCELCKCHNTNLLRIGHRLLGRVRLALLLHHGSFQALVQILVAINLQGILAKGLNFGKPLA